MYKSKFRKLNPYKIESYDEFNKATISDLKNYLRLKGFDCYCVGNKSNLIYHCIDIYKKYGSVKIKDSVYQYI